MFTFLKNIVNSIFFSTNKKTEVVSEAPYKVEVRPVEETSASTSTATQVASESVSVSVTSVEPVEIKATATNTVQESVPVEVKTTVVNSTPETVKADKPKRARDQKGRLKADDKSTEIVNEAWVGGKAPEKKSKPKTKKSANTSESKKMRVVNLNK